MYHLYLVNYRCRSSDSKPEHLIFQTMKKNMGSADRIIRVILAAIIATLYFTDILTGTLGIVLLVLSVVFVLTSLVGFCPLYAPFGLKTCAEE